MEAPEGRSVLALAQSANVTRPTNMESSPSRALAVPMVPGVPSGPKREVWGKGLEFLLALIGFAVGLGSVQQSLPHLNLSFSVAICRNC